MATQAEDTYRSAYTPSAETDINQPGGSSSPRRDCIRHHILHQHLEKVLRKSSSPTTSRVSQGLALSALLRAEAAARDHEDVRVAGGLSPDDLTKMAPVPLAALRLALLQELESDLKSTILAIAEYYSSDNTLNDPDTQDDDRLHDASQLPDRIRKTQATLAQQRAALREHRARVLELVEHINATQPALEEQLTRALTTLPPHLRAARTAQADVLGATVEAALLKLSLVRARAHRALYAFSPPPSKSAPPPAPRSSSVDTARTVADAVAAAHAALLARERAQEAERRALDGQLAAYERMLGLVEGGQGREGAFAQVVRDMARVKRETEECRKDLRRLGWTGD